MSVTNGPRRGLMINALTGENFDADFRKLLRALDALLMCSVLDKSHSAPPGSPANGDAYIVKATGSGAWSGHDDAIAIWTTDNPAGNVWEFYPAAEGIIVFSIADAGLLAWDGAAWSAVGGGGGGVTAGTPVFSMGSQQPAALGPLGTGQTMMLKIPGRALNCLPSSWKVRIRRGAGSHFSAIVILRTAIDDTTVIDSTPVTFGGSATPAMSAGLNLSDAISLALDASHDYYVAGYNDSGDSSFWGIKPAVTDPSYSLGVVGGYLTGDQTGVSTVAPASISSGFGCPWDAVLAA